MILVQEAPIVWPTRGHILLQPATLRSRDPQFLVSFVHPFENIPTRWIRIHPPVVHLCNEIGRYRPDERLPSSSEVSQSATEGWSVLARRQARRDVKATVPPDGPVPLLRGSGAVRCTATPATWH